MKLTPARIIVIVVLLTLVVFLPIVPATRQVADPWSGCTVSEWLDGKCTEDQVQYETETYYAPLLEANPAFSSLWLLGVAGLGLVLYWHSKDKESENKKKHNNLKRVK
ncbi:hypothetical protein E3E35_09400 [Thermococcus sp. GR7]|uniref:hypothetical protein n=2 Tax=Thermococcus TaxID=2263 RepID=UPI001430B929|nr:hypothetical protein [Thermococcus sp. GR7]NJE47607.1 hypothetical protein [Thermococcus sp. GR7]